MNKSAVLGAALLAGLSLLPRPAPAQQVRILVQSSPLAGFNFHQAPGVWRGMRLGDVLRLEREPDNAYDARAVRVEWQGHTLGYVPRAQNAAIAWAMDRGEVLRASVSRLQPHRNPRKRIEFEVYVDQGAIAELPKQPPTRGIRRRASPPCNRRL